MYERNIMDGNTGYEKYEEPWRPNTMVPYEFISESRNRKEWERLTALVLKSLIAFVQEFDRYGLALLRLVNREWDTVLHTQKMLDSMRLPHFRVLLRGVDGTLDPVLDQSRIYIASAGISMEQTQEIARAFDIGDYLYAGEQAKWRLLIFRNDVVTDDVGKFGENSILEGIQRLEGRDVVLDIPASRPLEILWDRQVRKGLVFRSEESAGG